MKKMSIDILFLHLLINMIIIKQVHSHNKVLNKLRKCQKEENEVKLPHIQNNLYLEDLTPLHNEVKMLNVENNVAEEQDLFQFELQYCKCARKLRRKDNIINDGNNVILFNQTTCSMDAFNRGPGQKIVGFSYYKTTGIVLNQLKGYFEGIKRNLKLMPKYYPRWTMRLYVDLDANDPVFQDLCILACKNPILDICDVKNLPGTPYIDAHTVFPMNWRFFPTLDPQVDAFVSRDLDSIFSLREQAAVEEWFKSNKVLHIMRDHPAQNEVILGGLWGTKLTNYKIRSNWKESWNAALKDKLLWARKDSYGHDQHFLLKYVWPWLKNNSIAHDAYNCEKFPNTKPFPIQRLRGQSDNFLGAIPSDGTTLKTQCPLACRPLEHQDWIFC